MNYRALEDLIGILVKKSGFKLSDLKVEEDIDFLEDRKKYLEGEIASLKNTIETSPYLDKEDKMKDEEEKAYLEETLKTLNNNLADLDTKLNDKNAKLGVKRRLTGEKALLTSEISRVNELLELANLKLVNKAYFDTSMKTKDETTLAVLESELKEVNDSLEIKYNNPVILGNKLLEAFKDNKSFDQVNGQFELLLNLARTEYDKTNGEVKDSNIFELMDKYTTMKRDTATSLENNEYSSEEIRQSLFEKEKYHNSRLETFKRTLDGIEKRKEELRTLIDESKKLYDSVHKEIDQKEDKLTALVNVLYNESNLIVEEEDYKKTVNELRNEIVDDKFLENKYNTDIQNFKDEIKNLDINYTNINAEMASEERSLEIIHDKLNNNKAFDNINKFTDKVNFLVYSNRVENLVNEQQYLYVNVDVIKDEVMSLWSKGDDSAKGEVKSYGVPKTEPVEEEEEVDEEENNTFQTNTSEVIEEPTPEAQTSMYEESTNNEQPASVEPIDFLE